MLASLINPFFADAYDPTDDNRERTSDLFNSGQELGGLQPLSFLGRRLQGSLANFLSPIRWVGLF
jgi:hypothetical protein